MSAPSPQFRRGLRLPGLPGFPSRSILSVRSDIFVEAVLLPAHHDELIRKDWTQRPLPLRQRQEVQEVLSQRGKPEGPLVRMAPALSAGAGPRPIGRR